MPHSALSANFWLETSGDDLCVRPSLEGHHQADVAILGAGYTGLWTAYYLLKHRPDLRIVIVEGSRAGFGASGRNGGWLSPGFPISVGRLTEAYGREAARRTLRAMEETVDEVIRVAETEDIDAHVRRGGVLRVARGNGQVEALRRAFGAYQALGFEDYRLLSAVDTSERVAIARVAGGLFTHRGASIHPGRLVRGLARTLERRGATIFENSLVTALSGRPSPRLITRHGKVQADTIVLAGEAFMTGLRRLHRRLLPVHSSIIVTEPLSSDLWQEIGWRGYESLSSMRLTVDYLTRTQDGRILFGSRGEPYAFGSRLPSSFDASASTLSMLKRQLCDWFPMLDSIRIEYAWSAPVGMPRDWMPSATFCRESGFAFAGGYTGQGVATSNLAGRLLAGLITDRPSELTQLPMAGHIPRNWEPEPLRWLAVRGIQRGLERADRRSERSGRSPTGRNLTVRLSRH